MCVRVRAKALPSSENIPFSSDPRLRKNYPGLPRNTRSKCTACQLPSGQPFGFVSLVSTVESPSLVSTVESPRRRAATTNLLCLPPVVILTFSADDVVIITAH